MTLLMAEILGVWVLALLAGVPLFATMGLAAFAFVAFGGLSMSIVPQKLAQSVNSFPLLAAPLFILMGNIMNSAGITERIFTLRDRLRRLAARRAVPRQHPGQRDLRRHVGLGGRGRGRHRHARDQGDARRGLRRRDRGGDHGRLRDDRADHPAVAADGDLRRSADVSIGGLFLAGVVPAS